jgi:hypothetical protein
VVAYIIPLQIDTSQSRGTSHEPPKLSPSGFGWAILSLALESVSPKPTNNNNNKNNKQKKQKTE